jgi:hypothetical protein
MEIGKSINIHVKENAAKPQIFIYEKNFEQKLHFVTTVNDRNVL